MDLGVTKEWDVKTENRKGGTGKENGETPRWEMKDIDGGRETDGNEG